MGRVWHSRARFWAVLLALACIPAAPAMASAVNIAETTDEPQPSAQVEDPIELLTRVQQAARKLDYAGVFMYQQGELLQSSRLVHLADEKGEGERERLEVLDGQPREYLRHNDHVLCLVPERKTVLLERRGGDRFPGLLLGDTAGLANHYNIQAASSLYRVAGRSCRLILIEPKDNFRYGYRLCVDVDTNLLLKAQTVNTAHAVLDQAAFTSLRLGNKVDGEMLKSDWLTHDWKVLEANIKPVDLAAQGWRISAPPGFVPITQITRTIGRGVSVSQLVLSDGLAIVSVFIEPYKNQRGYSQTQRPIRRGASNIYGARVANFWLTAVGEVPPATLEWVTQSAAFEPGAASK